jgi:succinate-semialdehyde dehydrogenase / glutarate-semialdehyde dehydrogenase
MAVIDSVQRINVKNPVTGEIIGSVPDDQDVVHEAVARARAAQPAWAALGVRERGSLLRRWQSLIWEHEADLIQTIRAESGKTRGGAYQEIAGIDNTIEYYARRAPGLLRPQSRRTAVPFIQRARLYYKPRGVVGVISPWNYPFLLTFIDLIPALIAGNTVVLKPSEVTPFSAQRGVELLYEAGVPRDAIQIVNGTGETGAALVDEVDYVMFTGSTATGRKVAVRAAERLIPYSLELGGKDPLIVLNDADLKKAAAGTLAGGLENAGQACVSTERVYVESGVYDAFIERLLHHIERVEVGADGDMGSLTNRRELQRVEDHIADAVAKGARVIHGGGRRPDLGELFFEPTVVVDVDHTMRIMQEETFGPVVSVMRVADAEEAIQLANDSEYGLSACLYTSDLSRAEALAQQIDTGDVSINRPLWIWSTADAPMGGQKQSGIGRRNGPEGLLRFVTTQTIMTDRMLSVLGQDVVHLTPRLRQMITLRKLLRPFVPFVRP